MAVVAVGATWISLTALAAAIVPDRNRDAGAIEREVRDRRDLLEKLRRDQRTFEELARLSRPEVNAVSQALRAQVREENESTFRKDVIMSLAVGTVTSTFSGAFFYFLGRRRGMRMG